MYSPLPRRIRALLVDSLLMALYLSITVMAILQFGINESWLGSAIVIFVVLSVEPLMITFTGSTFGQHLYGIEVRSLRSGKRLSIFLSYLRFFAKIPLGIFSLVTVLSSEHYQGIHDKIARSVVVHKNSDKAPLHERLPPRVLDSDEYVYPSRLRRSLVVAGYLLLSFLLLTIISVVWVSEGCLNYDACTRAEDIVLIFLSLSFYVWIFVAVAFGWRGKLYGCRRKLRSA